MATRTASASGTIKNTGTTSITFSVHMTFGGVSSARKSVTLTPGAISPTISLSVSRFVDPGETVSAGVFLHRESPEPRDYIGSSPTTSWTEPHSYTGELTGFTPGIASLRGPELSFSFVSDGYSVGQMRVTDWMPWVIAGVVLGMMMLSRPRRLFRRRK